MDHISATRAAAFSSAGEGPTDRARGAGCASVATVALDIALDTLVASFVALTTAILYFDLLARARSAYSEPSE